MKLLFSVDSKNYTDDLPTIERYAVRAVICKDGLLAMQRGRNGEYKIPGGGIEKDESNEEALGREVLEETGLHVIRGSIKEIGEVLEIRKDSFDKGQKFIQHSYYYFCDVENIVSETAMTEREMAQGFRLEWETLENIIAGNEKIVKADWQKRDQLFLKWLNGRSSSEWNGHTI